MTPLWDKYSELFFELLIWAIVFFSIFLILKKFWYFKEVSTEDNLEIDIDSFEYLWWPYARDKSNLYYEWEKFEEEIDMDSIEYLWWLYIKDKNNAFHDGDLIEEENIHVNTFEYLWWEYAKDKNNFYHLWYTIDDDELDFKHLGWDYIKKDGKIYFDYH